MVRSRRLHVWLALAVIGGILTICSCDRKSGASPRAAMAVSNSYLASATYEVAGGSLGVFCLAPPGTCPGHFDIRPSQVDALRRCRLLLRFEFQGAIDAQLKDIVQAGLQIQSVKVPGGMCEPSSYLAACRQTAEAMVAANLADREATARQLDQIEQRLKVLADECLAQMHQAGLDNAPVLCSVHQQGFCRWLGLNVVEIFSGSDSASLGQLDSAIEAGRMAGARLVIGNQPEGRGAADALAEQIDARVVVFENFPAAPQDKGTYEAMARGNVERLARTSQP